MSENKLENGFNEESVNDGTKNISAEENITSEEPLGEKIISEEESVSDSNASNTEAENKSQSDNTSEKIPENSDAAESTDVRSYPEKTEADEASQAADVDEGYEAPLSETESEEKIDNEEDKDDILSEAQETDGDVSEEKTVFITEEEPIDSSEADSSSENDSAEPTDKDSYLYIASSEASEDEYDEDAFVENDENYTEDEDEDKDEDKDEAEDKKKKPGTRGIDSLFDFVELFIFSLAAVFIITTFFFRHSVVDGDSMESTLFDGEHIIISDLFYKPERGDIIVCEDYSTELPVPVVKRVIAIGGDRITIDAQGIVKVNNVALDESDYVYIDNPFYEYTPYDIIVPEGELFVMGDHRNVSSDSRDPERLGTVKEDSVLGKVLFRFYPFDRFGAVE